MCNSKCTGICVAKILLIIGGLNWGLVGVGMLVGSDLNVVKMLLGSWPTVEAIVYILVGIAAIASIFCCKCGKCKNACCTADTVSGAEEVKM